MHKPGKTPQETALTPDAEALQLRSPALLVAMYVRLEEAWSLGSSSWYSLGQLTFGMIHRMYGLQFMECKA